MDEFVVSKATVALTSASSSAISMYRGDVIHRGYIPFSRNDRDVEDAVRLVMHLHDVAACVTLKIVGYGGR